MIERPDSAGIWTREGKFYRVWTVDGRWFTQEITPSDGGLWPIYERNESSPFPPGNWHKLTAPATNAAARDKFRAWLATDKPLRGPIHKRVEEHVADKAAEIFAGVEREQIDWPRLREWAADQRKKPPQLAFTAGPEREIADLICMVVMSSELDQITTLKATVARLEEQVATEHAKYVNSERAATVALQAQTILKQAEEIAELKQQPEVIEGNGQAVSEEQAGWYWAEGSKGTVAYMHIVAGSAFAQDCRYIKAVPPTFPPRKPAFVAPPKPEQFLYRWRRLNGTEEVFWTTKRSEGHYIGVLDGCMYTSGELIDEKTGEVLK